MSWDERAGELADWWINGNRTMVHDELSEMASLEAAYVSLLASEKMSEDQRTTFFNYLRQQVQ